MRSDSRLQTLAVGLSKEMEHIEVAFSSVFYPSDQYRRALPSEQVHACLPFCVALFLPAGSMIGLELICSRD